jgi:Protein of unknown function (DUF2568)
MEILKSANVVLRFLLELCVLAAVAFWGATTSLRVPARIALAVSLPLIVAVIWALVVSPGVRIDLGPLRLGVELVIFAAGVAALLTRGRIVLGLLLAVLYVGNKILMTVWDQ